MLDNELVTQNGYRVLSEQNEPIIVNDDNEFVQNIVLIKTDFKNLDKIGNNNYRLYDQNNVQAVVDGNNLLQGGLEQSNVNTIKSMVTLIEAQRKFEQAQKAMNGIDEINQKVIDGIGNNR